MTRVWSGRGPDSGGFPCAVFGVRLFAVRVRVGGVADVPLRGVRGLHGQRCRLSWVSYILLVGQIAPFSPIYPS